jgi:uncharacterized membrane protein (UPF0127 family)
VTLDDRRLRWLLAAALVLVGAGLWFFVLRGADQPEDPFLVDASTTSVAATAPGGDPAVLGTAPAGVAAPSSPGTPFGGFDEVAIAVTPPDGGAPLLWCLLAAIAPEQRAQGLIGVTDLQGYPGMAFLYETEWQNSYHMRDVPMPLSIAWVAGDGEIVTITDMEPCLEREECPTYGASGTYRMAIEVPQGRLDELGIVPGARVARAGACAAGG